MVKCFVISNKTPPKNAANITKPTKNRQDDLSADLVCFTLLFPAVFFKIIFVVIILVYMLVICLSV